MTSAPSAAIHESRAGLDEARERRVALWLTLLVLLVLTAVKPIGNVPVVGTIAMTIAAGLQLYLPLWRADKLDVPYATFGLHLQNWRRDLRLVVLLCAITFPPYVLGHHLYMTAAHGWADQLGLPALAAYLPQREWSPHLPATFGAWIKAVGWLLEIAATHALGVALPEETFYRGYLLPRLETRFVPRLTLLGVPIGRAAVLVAFLFAAGHFLGDWNPLRWGPFFPALVFAWQRNATGSILGAVSFHALCNIVGEVLNVMYHNPAA